MGADSSISPLICHSIRDSLQSHRPALLTCKTVLYTRRFEVNSRNTTGYYFCRPKFRKSVQP